MKIKKIEDIFVWNKAKELTIKIYKSIKSVRDFSFKDQIQRAAVSIMNNIAEGYERGGNKELKHFLFVAKGSCGELRSMLHLALELNYISKDEFNSLYNLSLEISKMLSGFIKTL
ncbi:MAG: four helix bundle protein [Microgenomates group bacterium]